ncbi:MAG: flavodoxin family protein [Candidatus Hermodarchaeia archaeon]
MAKMLVIYDSKSGNTEKMAFAIAEGIKTFTQIIVEVKKVTQVQLEDLQAADGIIVGSPTYYGDMSAKVKDLMDRSVDIHGKLEGKVGAAFTSSGGTATGAETTLLSIIQAMLIHGMIVQGRANTDHYGAAAVGSPNKDELKSCQDLGKRTANLMLTLTS